MGNMLDSPRTEKDDGVYVSSAGLKAGYSGMQGWRLEMEDAEIVKDFPSKPDHMLVAVFDGHGGGGAAIYAAKHLMNVIEANKDWKEYVATGATNLKALSDALTESFCSIDRDIRAHQDNTPADQSGCTAVICVVTPHYVMCANAGDSRCVISTRKSAKGMSEDHKPDDDIERNRIERAGGKVQMSRVEGNLAVSRAFGDFEYKDRPDLPQSEQKVSCIPDIFLHARSSDDDVLLLACDGLWDVFSNAEAIAETNILLEEGDTMDVISGKLLDASLAKGSKDNVTAVVVDLRGSKEAGASPPSASAASLPVKYGRYGYPKQDFGFQGGR